MHHKIKLVITEPNIQDAKDILTAQGYSELEGTHLSGMGFFSVDLIEKSFCVYNSNTPKIIYTIHDQNDLMWKTEVVARLIQSERISKRQTITLSGSVIKKLNEIRTRECMSRMSDSDFINVIIERGIIYSTPL